MDSFGRLKDRQVDDMVGCDHFIQHFKQVAQQKAAKVNNSNSKGGVEYPFALLQPDVCAGGHERVCTKILDI